MTHTSRTARATADGPLPVAARASEVRTELAAGLGLALGLAVLTAVLSAVLRLALLAGLLSALPCAAHDLLSVYRQALDSDPLRAAAAARREIVREAEQQDRARLHPQAGAQWTAQIERPGVEDTGAASGGSQTTSSALTATVSQVLFDRSAARRIDAGAARSAAQDAVFRAAEQALCLRVATAYFEVLQAADSLRLVRANEDAFAQLVTHATKRYEQGLSAQVDVSQARAYLAAAQARTLGAVQTLADAREVLQQMAGVAVDGQAPLAAFREPTPLAAPMPADVAAWEARARAQHPLLRAAVLDVEATQQLLAAGRAARWPTVGADLQWGRSTTHGLSSGGSDGRPSVRVGLQLQLPLFDSGLRASQLRQATAEQQLATQALEDTRRQVLRDVRQSHRAVLTAIDQARTARAGMQAAQQALAATRVGQGLGTQTLTDVLLAIQTLTAAQDLHIQARHRYVLSLLQLLQAGGELGEPQLAALNQTLLTP
jgi:outer membrane protein